MLLHDGQPATVFYSALCGGKSELASELWPGAVDYVSSAADRHGVRGEPGWSSEVRVEQLERALRDAWRIAAGGCATSGCFSATRRAACRGCGSKGSRPTRSPGNDFRMAVGRVAGWQLIKSTAFDVRRTGSGYRFRGRGFGHGVGLCVIGAGNRAAAGASAEPS